MSSLNERRYQTSDVKVRRLQSIKCSCISYLKQCTFQGFTGGECSYNNLICLRQPSAFAPYQSSKAQAGQEVPMYVPLPVLKGEVLQVFLEGCHLSLHVLQACGCHILSKRFILILHPYHSAHQLC